MFKYINYPSVPLDIVDHLLDRVANFQSEKQLTGFQKMYVNESINKEVSRAYDHSDLGLGISTEEALKMDDLSTMTMFTDDILSSWIEENIPEKINAAHVQFFSKGSFFFPHVDLLRHRAINYVINSADAETVFYKPKSEFSHLDIKPNTCIPYDRINEVNRFKIESRNWHELEVDNIHSVENINGTRIAITLSIV